MQAIPGVLEYEGARIQLLDLPGIVEGAAMGRGRGRQVISVAKTADVIIIMSEWGPHSCLSHGASQGLTAPTRSGRDQELGATAAARGRARGGWHSAQHAAARRWGV